MAGPSPDSELFVEGIVARITYESDDTGFRVVRLDTKGGAPVTVVGKMPKLHEGTRVRVRGTRIEDPKFGPQIRVLAVTELAPDTLAGLEKYLASGLLKGVGPKTAERIVTAFGLDTMKVLDEEPWMLRKVSGLGKAKADLIAAGWAEQRSVRDVMVFLQAHGASSALAYRVHKRYGADAIRLVKEDPYRLSLEVWGIGFRTADKLAQSLGVAKDDPKRVEAGVFQALSDAKSTGHTYLGTSELETHAAPLLELPEEILHDHVVRAVVSLVAKGHAVREREDAIYPAPLYAAETRLASRLLALAEDRQKPLGDPARAIERFERERNMELAEAQRAAIRLASERSLVVITGGPGVGKTTLVRAVLSMIREARLDVRLAAPTGRAAKRMTEATGQPAMTVHRLLDFDPRVGKFQKSGSDPLEGHALVVDEASMLDIEMADALFDAVPPGMRVVLVGDVDQLPSVGPGAVLRDLIASGTIPYVRLTHIFRQGKGSLIVQNAHRINAGEMPENPPPGDDSDFFIVERKDPDEARRTILELVQNRIPNRFGLDPLRDIQVLTPMHRGPVGSLLLNTELQAALNPVGPSINRGERTFRVGDKVMQLKNDYDREVFNGDIGFVRSVDLEETTLVVRFDDERDVAYDAAALDELVLAYASSIHKSQGSEYAAVVLPLLTSHWVMLSRNLFYTGVTRGKRLVVVVGDPRAIRVAVGRDGSSDRHTGLAERLRSPDRAPLD